MSGKLNNVCENCGFDDNLKELLESIEIRYDLILKAEGGDGLDMVDWILKNTSEMEELKCLSEKEKFIFGFSSLMNIIMNY